LKTLNGQIQGTSSSDTGPSVTDSSSPFTIGIRDSGVGGLTVARCVKQKLPHARLLYFADTAHVPYGERTPAEVRHYALSISQFLIQRGAQALIFACNTSSALALELARDRFDVPIFGTIEPGARAGLAATRNGRIGVIATQATVNSGVYGERLRTLDSSIFALEEACPEFVPLVESERTISDEARAAAVRYLQPLIKAGCDTVVLGCTHYPLLLQVLQEVAPEITFVDPAILLADEVLSLGATSGGMQNAPHDRFFASGESEGLGRWIDKLLPGSGQTVESGPVFNLQTVHTAAFNT
jgi:glutamate racemase